MTDFSLTILAVWTMIAASAVTGIWIQEKRKKQAEAELASEKERMAVTLCSIGTLAGGIAHDLNNIMTAILGNISLTKISMDPEDDMYSLLTEAEKATLRAKNLTQQLLTFSKDGAPITKTTSIVKLVKDTASFALRGSKVRCEYSIPHDLWPVEIDEGQICQVIDNLIINADQAMPGGGTVKIHCENIVNEEDNGLPLKEGRYVRIAIKDHGIGINNQHIGKIFDPYFTTKQKGSGLGLATVYSIIQKHDGHIKVESKEGDGTTFYICIPASGKEIQIEKEIEKKLLINVGNILVVDDEEIVRDVITKMLSKIGYTVTTVPDGKEAIILYQEAKEYGNGFDIVIIDLTIPGGMGGKETMEKLLEIDKKVKAIVSSGYSNNPIMADFKKYGFEGFVAKPYNMQELSQKLDKLIV